MKHLFKFICFAFVMSLMTFSAHSQVVISTNSAAVADPAAILDLQSTSQGFLAPRLTIAQIAAIANPPKGLMVYQTDGTEGYYYNFGTPLIPEWSKVVDEDDVSVWAVNGNDIYTQNTGNVGIGTPTPGAKLDVDGTARITGAVQLLNGATNGYVFTSDASGNATWQDVNTLVTNDGDWTVAGDTVYSATNVNVGIGTSLPGTKLDVAGPAWFNDSIAIDGRPGRLYVNGQTNYEPYMSFNYEDVAKYTMHYRIPDGTYADDFFMIDTEEYDEVWGISDSGQIRHTYHGTGIDAAYYMETDLPGVSLDIVNNNSSSATEGINVSLHNTSSAAGAACFAAYNYGAGYGLFASSATDENFGFVGHPTWAIYGQYGDNDNRGNIGTSTAGVMGIYDSEMFIGLLGYSSAGVYGDLGQLAGATQDLEDGDFGVKGLGVNNSSESGSGYAYDETIGGVVGYNEVGVTYGFGVAGYTADDANNRTGGVLGYIGTDDWGALGYRANNNSLYGGYFNGGIVQDGNGKAQTEPSTNIGIGVYGDLFGAQVNGNIYGLYATGENYGIYSDGDMYRTGADVHLQENANGENSVMYTLVSTEMTVQTYGVGSMQAGKSNIVFDQAFADVVSNDEPIVVTITPIGQTKGVYLDRVDANGFAVAENAQGKSNVQFSWIAIGKRKGYENISLAADVTASDYNNKVQRGLASDANPNTEAEGLYYHNGQLHNGQLPGTPKVNTVKSNSPRSTVLKAELGIVAPKEDRRKETSTKDVKID